MLYDEYIKVLVDYYDGYTEEKFNAILEVFKDFEIPEIDFFEMIQEERSLEKEILYAICEDCCSFYIEDWDITNKKVYIDDWEVPSIEDLNQIKDTLAKGGWTIANYEDLIEDIKEREEEDKINDLRYDLRNKIQGMSDKELLNLKEYLNGD